MNADEAGENRIAAETSPKLAHRVNQKRGELPTENLSQPLIRLSGDGSVKSLILGLISPFQAVRNLRATSLVPWRVGLLLG